MIILLKLIKLFLKSNNILLIHQKGNKLAGFGFSRKIAEASSKIFGIIPYVNTKCFSNERNQSKNYTLNKKSGVYIIGILVWQISSGRKPFEDQGSNRGKREKTIYGTPIKYSNLY